MIDIKVFVIKSRNRSLDTALLSFIHDNDLDMIESPGVFLKSGSNLDSVVDFKECHLRIGRNITLSEIGIALAHRQIYKRIIEEDCAWALVLEDDAFITNANLFKKQIENSICFSPDIPRVSLLFHHAKRLVDSQPNSTFKRSTITPSYAVAYALNKSAAIELLESQTPITSVADWPLCTHKIDYWLSNSFAIMHGSETYHYNSYLDGMSRSPSNILDKWRWILGIDLIRFNRVSLKALHRHYCFVIKPRLSLSRS